MKITQLTLDDTVIQLGGKKSVQANFNYTIDRFGPIISICYIVCHAYAFIIIMNFWNNFDILTMAFSGLHMTVPLYTIALSAYQAPLAQFIIYYFSSTVTTIASALLAIEAAFLGLGLLAQGTSETQSMGIFTGNFVSNILVVMGPFAAITAFLQYAVIKYEKDYKPEKHRLF
jgi:hypothetical protein